MKWEWLACPRATTMQASCLLQYVRNGIIRSAGLRLRPSPSILYSSETMKELIRPHGGELRELFADAARASVLKQEALALPSCDLTLRQQAELALLMNGAYSPLSGFMCRADYDAVLETGHLASGELWPLPVTLDIDEALAVKLTPGAALALRDLEGVLFAVLRVDEVWRPDREVEAMRLFGTTDTTHPGVGLLLGKTLAFYVGGRVEGVEAPSYHSFTGLRHSPAELRREFAKRGWTRVAAFHTTVPIHAAQQRVSTRAARGAAVGAASRLVPGAPSPFVVGRAEYLPLSEAASETEGRRFDEAELQRRLRAGLDIPAWFSFPEVNAELRGHFPARSRQGYTLFFTGLSGSGKSTIAKAVLAKLLELSGRPMSLLDGDVVRKHLSSELGFSKEHRNINIRRSGYVASEITKNGGFAICAPIAPYAELRREVWLLFGLFGGFFVF